jgi:hypothetical protein
LSQSEVQFTIEFDIVLNLEEYRSMKTDGKLLTAKEAAEFEKHMLESGEVGIEEFIDDADIKVSYKVVN